MGHIHIDLAEGNSQQALRNEFRGGGGPGLQGPYGKGPKRQKGPQSVCKNNKLPKHSTMSAKKAHLKKIPGPIRSLPRDEISGAREGRSPGPTASPALEANRQQPTTRVYGNADMRHME